MKCNFLRYLETEVYRGFIQVGIQYLKEKYAVHDVNILPWNLYTCKDIQLHEAKSSKIKSSNYIQYLTSQKLLKFNISSHICIIILLNFKNLSFHRAKCSVYPEIRWWQWKIAKQNLHHGTTQYIEGQTERPPLCSFCAQKSSEPYQI